MNALSFGQPDINQPELATAKSWRIVGAARAVRFGRSTQGFKKSATPDYL
jgi:hypothetical protein